jgi:hypothetical protein
MTVQFNFGQFMHGAAQLIVSQVGAPNNKN